MTTALETQLEDALAARRRARRYRAILALVASFAALVAVILPMPANIVLYAIATAAVIGATVFIVQSGRAKQQAARAAAELHELDPYLEILPTLPKPVAKATRALIDVRSNA